MIVSIIILTDSLRAHCICINIAHSTQTHARSLLGYSPVSVQYSGAYARCLDWVVSVTAAGLCSDSPRSDIVLLQASSVRPHRHTEGLQLQNRGRTLVWNQTTLFEAFQSTDLPFLACLL